MKNVVIITIIQTSGLAIFVKITQFIEKGVVQFSKYWKKYSVTTQKIKKKQLNIEYHT